MQAYTNLTLTELSQQLDLSAADVQAAVTRYLPYGAPQLNMPDATVCQLTQQDYITGYSHQLAMPLWSAYVVNPQVRIHVMMFVCVNLL